VTSIVAASHVGNASGRLAVGSSATAIENSTYHETPTKSATSPGIRSMSHSRVSGRDGAPSAASVVVGWRSSVMVLMPDLLAGGHHVRADRAAVTDGAWTVAGALRYRPAAW
jgi:hypothetical protein